MTILKIVEAPNPVLKQKARPVRPEEFGYDLEKFMNDMVDTMYEGDGIGLAAPQVGDSRRILVAEPCRPGEDEAKVPLSFMVNPEIIERSEEMVGCEGGEGCLSLPGFLFMVPRHKVIRVKWQTPDGEEHTRQIRDFRAMVIQHEIDHLDGITLLERASRAHRRSWLRARKKNRSRKKPTA